MKRAGFVISLATAWMLNFSSSTQARIVAIEIEKTEPFAAGTTFGSAGSYVRIVGKARGELDPSNPVNKGIVNLDKAPRNTRGMVEYETDLFILRPADFAKGNGTLLYEVNNRGRKFLSVWLMDATPVAGGAINDPTTVEHAGNGFFLRKGYTIVWSGWDPDAPRAGNGLAMTVPVATNNGQPIVRMIRDELASGTRAPEVDAFRLSYAAASLDQSQAVLTVRRKEAYAKTPIPASGWVYADARTIKLLPAGTKPEPGALYELTYPAKDPKVLGIGYAATRDVVSFLRYAPRDDSGAANPVGGTVRHALGVGISQSGRYLRDHVSQGFNQDETKRKVFDGVLAHISGIGRVFHNAEFGQPFRTNTQHEDHTYPENAFPFAAATVEDPVSGRSGALWRHDGFDPLLIEVNTSTEYWQKGASLLHTDPLGRRDLALDKNARVFMVAGTQHGGRAGLNTAPGPCVNLRNPHSAAPALRALIVALDEWVTTDKAPPDSRVPTIKAGTLVLPDKTGFPAIPGATVTREINQIALFDDWVKPAARPKTPYRPLVAKVDNSGNEVAGIRLPDIAVPLGTHTGWNLYKAPFPEGELCDRDGSFFAFARTKAERMARNDSRPSLEELYGDHAGYVRKVEAAAAALVQERLLLQEDAERYIERARRNDPFKS
jgi:hypothetical protein